jgi:carbonic anhydrase
MKLGITTLLSFVAVTGCATSAAPATQPVAAPSAPAASPEQPHQDPDQEVDRERGHSTLRYLAQESAPGTRQSPINIVTKRAQQNDHQATLHYRASREHILNLGHTIEVDYDGGSTLEFDGGQYELRQFHFHTPSEHLLDGITYPMEVHLVHVDQRDPKQFLVVSVLFREGEDNAVVQRILPLVPAAAGGRVDIDDEIDATELLGAEDGYFFYEGSLTTPPYTEAVKWLVLDKAHEASPDQIEKVNSVEGDNARHIQANSAKVVEHCMQHLRE